MGWERLEVAGGRRGAAPYFVVAFVVGIAMLVAGLVALFFVGRGLGSQRDRDAEAVVEALFEPDRGFEGLVIPEFSLVDSNGETVDQSIFDGRYTVLTFIFTNCVLVCPDMTGRTAGLYDALDGTGARFVSISVDPERDTPEVLNGYASRFGADGERWRFLTGDPETVRRIASDGLMFDVSADPSPANSITLKDGSTMSNIIHPSALLLIDPQRRVLGRYRYQFDDEIEALERRIKAIVAIERSRED